MRTPRILVPAIAAAALVTVLAGCSTAEGERSATTPSASVSKPAVLPDADVRVPEAKETAKCIDGVAIVDQSGTEVTLEGACAKVTVSGNDSIVHLGDIDELIVESAISRITVGTAKTVTLSGNANDVLFTGDKPVKITDEGTGNVVQPKGK